MGVSVAARTENGKTIVIGGSTGMIGTRLSHVLREKGARVIPLVRPSSKNVTGEESIPWDPDQGVLDGDRLEGVDAVVHLGGVNVASGPWTRDRKRRIRDSRVKSTALLSQKIASCTRPPEVFVCASAIGIYPDKGEAWLDEETEPGEGFLSKVAREWEEAAGPAVEVTRVVHPRIGIVLSTEGGALAKMLTPFRLGLGGKLGDGRQYMSWIECDDLVNALVFFMEHPEIRGPVNMAAPHPVTNAEFTKTLGRVLGRPTLIPAPSFAINLAMGQMGRALLLSGNRVSARKLEAAGFRFRHPTLKEALEHLLRR